MRSIIEPTPVLHGEDAKRLLRSVGNPVYDPDKEKFLELCDSTFRRLCKL